MRGAAPQHRQHSEKPEQVERRPEHRHRDVRVIPPSVRTADQRGQREDGCGAYHDAHPPFGRLLVAAALRGYVKGHVAERKDQIADDVGRDANPDDIPPDAVQQRGPAMPEHEGRQASHAKDHRPLILQQIADGGILQRQPRVEQIELGNDEAGDSNQRRNDPIERHEGEPLAQSKPRAKPGAQIKQLNRAPRPAASLHEHRVKRLRCESRRHSRVDEFGLPAFLPQVHR